MSRFPGISIESLNHDNPVVVLVSERASSPANALTYTQEIWGILGESGLSPSELIPLVVAYTNCEWPMIGEEIVARDTFSRFYSARVIDRHGNRLQIAYNDWSPRWEEWIDRDCWATANNEHFWSRLLTIAAADDNGRWSQTRYRRYSINSNPSVMIHSPPSFLSGHTRNHCINCNGSFRCKYVYEWHNNNKTQRLTMCLD